MSRVSAETANLEELDRGGYLAAVEAFRAGVVDVAAPDGALYAAEAALYLDELETARRLAEPHAALAWLDADGSRADLARRARLLLAEAAYAERDFAAAADLARSVVEVARGAGDEQAAMRATFCLARVAFRRGAGGVACERFEAVAASAAALGNRFYEGLAAYFLAYGRMQADDVDGAGECFPTALDALAAEGGLWYARALNAHGGFLSERGDHVTALAEFDRARRIASSLGLAGDLHWIEANTARSLVLLGRSGEAAARYIHLIDAARRDGHPAEISNLHWLAVALHDVGRYREAVDAADAMLALAALVGDEGDRIAARIVGARARAILDGGSTAIAELERWAASDDATEYQRAQSSLYLAEALATSDPDRARRLLDRARTLDVVDTTARLLGDLAVAEAALGRAAVRVIDGALVVAPDFGAVTVERVKAEVTRFLLADAMQREGGDVERAGARVGMSRTQAFQAVREFKLR